MKDDAEIWLQYSEENLQSAKLLLESGLFNPCLQYLQQCVEKALKVPNSKPEIRGMVQ